MLTAPLFAVCLCAADVAKTPVMELWTQWPLARVYQTQCQFWEKAGYAVTSLGEGARVQTQI